MKAGLLELGGVFVFGITTILGFSASQSRQPYNLTQIQFCPKSVNGELRQIELDLKYCYQPRFVLAKEWERYGTYGSIIPYKGRAIFKVKDIPTDNPHQLLGGGISVISLWGLTFCLLLRVNRLKSKDYKLGELEKTENYNLWQEQLATRDVRAHKTRLDREITKDRKSQYDLALRKELGLTNDENEAIQAQLNLEDYLKARETQHSAMEKQIAENLRDAAKARHEGQKFAAKTTTAEPVGEGKSSERARKDAIIARLKEHENGWLWDVVNGKKPLWVVGEQGGGKSSFATCICLIRYALFGWKLRVVVDAHGQKNINDAWKSLTSVFPNFRELLVGSNNNHGAIAQAFMDSIDIWAERMGENPKPECVQSIYDEMTQLSIEPDCKDAVKAFVRHSMSDTRGGRDRIICIAHTFTNAATGDATGFKELRDKSVILVERFSQDGEIPKSDVIYSVSGQQYEQTVPAWFKPTGVLKLLFEV